MIWKKVLKAVVFMVIFVTVFSYFSGIVTYPADYRNYHWIRGFYEEPENSLDAVYIGSSTVYSSWNSLVAWEKYGIAVYPYTCNSQHIITTEYLLKEVRKTQPDTLYIININTIYDEKMVAEEFHHLLDYMPFSLNKLQLTAYLAKTAELPFEEALELFVPMYRYHSRWNKLSLNDFNYEVDGMKGASYYDLYNRTIKNISKDYVTPDERLAPAPHIEEAVVKLLDYCEREKLNVLFVTMPRVEEKLEYSQQINYINDMIEARGFPTLNLMKRVDDITLNLKKDYYNKGHMNVHGSMKFTQFLSEHLIETYNFTDKRKDPAYASWNEGVEKYRPHLEERILDFEKDYTSRAADLSAPSGFTLTPGKEGIQISWKAVKGADGYVVYHKQAGGMWRPMITQETTGCVDSTVESGKRYYYTVVPYRNVDGVRYYGDFSYNGKDATAQ